jgi:hypothetical protein
MATFRVATAAALLLLLGACTHTPRRSLDTGLATDSLATDSTRTQVIFVVRRKWHIDVAFATDAAPSPTRFIGTRNADARYVIFGFGDRDYLMAKAKHTPLFLRALWPGPGLIRVTGLTVSPADAFGSSNVLAIAITPAQARAGRAFVAVSLTAQLKPLSAPRDHDGTVYFDTTARYSALHTCNTWVAEVLRATGLPVRSVGVVFADQLWDQARQISEMQALHPEQRNDSPALAAR